MNQCRNIIIDNRRQKAEIMNSKKAEQNKQIEKTMKKAAEAAEGERKEKKDADTIDNKRIRKLEKERKRNVNIEIASELIDLIIDVADETFDH